MKDPVVRRYLQTVIEVRFEHGRELATPLRKAAVAAILENPFAGGYVEDLTSVFEFSTRLGADLGLRLVGALGDKVQSYGKAAMVGVDGEQENGVAFVTTAFGDAVREAVGGGQAWISSVSTLGGPNSLLTIPLAHKDALYVRDNYDSVTLATDDGPRPREVLVAIAAATRGRPLARLGGLKATDIKGGGMT